MVRVLKGNRQAQLIKGVALFVKPDYTVEGRVVEQPTNIDLSSYLCVIFITEEDKDGNKGK